MKGGGGALLLFLMIITYKDLSRPVLDLKLETAGQISITVVVASPWPPEQSK